MGIQADIDAYKAQIDIDITTKTDPRSIPPDVVGSGFDDLADMVVLYYGQNFQILGGTGVPSDAIGSDNWLYFRDNSPMEVYQKISGTWVLGASVNWGVVFADGPLIWLLTSIAGSIVTVTSGQWAISNTLYQKATQTQFTLSAADLNFGRYDLIYANTSNQILKLEGTAASTPVIPTVPANSVMIDVAFIPSSSSGILPYLLYGNNSGSGVAVLITGTFDGSGEYDASGDGISAFPVYQVYNSTGYPIPVDYDNANKKLTGGTAGETFTARFI